MKALSIVVFVVLVLTGCTKSHANLTNVQPEQVLQGTLKENEATERTIQVTMPDGEVLTGQIQDAEGQVKEKRGSNLIPTIGGFPADGRASTFLIERNPDTQKHVYAILTSTTPGSNLEVEILGIYSELDGHGYGKARTNDGRRYELHFAFL